MGSTALTMIGHSYSVCTSPRDTSFIFFTLRLGTSFTQFFDCNNFLEQKSHCFPFAVMSDEFICPICVPQCPDIPEHFPHIDGGGDGCHCACHVLMLRQLFPGGKDDMPCWVNGRPCRVRLKMPTNATRCYLCHQVDCVNHNGCNCGCHFPNLEVKGCWGEMNCDTNCPGTPECMCLCHSEPNLSEENFFVSEEEREGTCGGDLNCEGECAGPLCGCRCTCHPPNGHDNGSDSTFMPSDDIESDSD